MRRPSRLLGAPRSQECHAPDLTSGNQECASVGYACTPHNRPPRSCWAEFWLCAGLRWFAPRFRWLRSLVPLVIGNPTAERFSARPVPYLSPHRQHHPQRSDPPPPGEPSFLSCASSLNACQVLACPQSCGELSNPETFPHHRVQTSVRGRSCPQVRSSCTRSFCVRLSSTEL